MMKTEQELDDFQQYLNSDEVRPSHTFILNEAKAYPPFTTHGLNSLPYVLMPAVALCMEKYASERLREYKERLREKMKGIRSDQHGRISGNAAVQLIDSTDTKEPTE